MHLLRWLPAAVKNQEEEEEEEQHEEERDLQFKAMAMIRVVSQKFSICAEMGISQILSGCWRPLVKKLHLLVLRVPASAPC
ncbi:hypothetical protein PGIGA_G00153270 [Pangasianodon gigas]|uniref:Uncharacterized protein n=1 Tax=Pangasianodon gigas TaxID=30993 RepID=A0ACC5XPC9_PANGG|nr:hypothetical protein [Pangasianodon gigas]